MEKVLGRYLGTLSISPSMPKYAKQGFTYQLITLSMVYSAAYLKISSCKVLLYSVFYTIYIFFIKIGRAHV